MTFFSALALFFFLPQLCFANILIKAVAGSFPPYIGENLNGRGAITQILKEAFELQGFYFQPLFVPWSRAYELVKTSKVECSYVWLHTEKRSKEVRFSKPVFLITNVLFYNLSKEFDWSSKADLISFHIGRVSGYSYGEFDKFLDSEAQNVVEVSSNESMLKMLCTGRINLAPIDIEVGQFLIKNRLPKNCQTKIAFHPRPLIKQWMHVIGDPNLTQKRWDMIQKGLEKGITHLKKTGRFDEVLWNIKMGKYNE